MNATLTRKFSLTILIVIYWSCASQPIAADFPNVVIIYADDLGWGDVSSYGATKLHTPAIDALAKTGIRFTNAHSAAATCTPSRYALVTGNYPFRQKDTGILPGDAKLIVPLDKMTLPKVFKEAGYVTAVIGKWHLGLGNTIVKNWNAEIKPGPLEVGFDYSFIFPATADRVPTVFMENHRVVGSNDADPIQVSYTEKIGDDPTGKGSPELLKMRSSPGQGHDNTIVNGIGRIGWMSGGRQARWADEEITFTFFDRLKAFVTRHRDKPFFLFYNATEPHVPRMPATIFKGKSDLGYRGDAILQLDHTVAEILGLLKAQGIYENTIIIFTSDNGPVLDDGYQDGAVEKLHGHDPFGGWRGGKYSAFEAGTRIPFIVSWPNGIEPSQVSGALVGQVDILASFAHLLGVPLDHNEVKDSKNMFEALVGKDKNGRTHLVKSAHTYALIKGDLKYILPSRVATKNELTNIELGNNVEEQLYNLAEDRAERKNIARDSPEKVAQLKALLEQELQK